jgi:hypothetical protein
VTRGRRAAKQKQAAELRQRTQQQGVGVQQSDSDARASRAEARMVRSEAELRSAEAEREAAEAERLDAIAAEKEAKAAERREELLETQRRADELDPDHEHDPDQQPRHTSDGTTAQAVNEPGGETVDRDDRPLDQSGDQPAARPADQNPEGRPPR